jgi:hypothetical protein
MRHEQEVRAMLFARCSKCGHGIMVENVSNDIMMMWQGTHCDLAQAYFADDDIFETLDDLDKKPLPHLRSAAS